MKYYLEYLSYFSFLFPSQTKCPVGCMTFCYITDRSPNTELKANGVIVNISESEISLTETFLGNFFLPLPLYQPENCNLFRYSTKSKINIANAASHEYFLVVSLTV